MSLSQVSEDMDSRRDILVLGEFVNKEISTSNSIMDQNCRRVEVRVAGVEVVHPERERQEDL